MTPNRFQQILKGGLVELYAERNPEMGPIFDLVHDLVVMLTEVLIESGWSAEDIQTLYGQPQEEAPEPSSAVASYHLAVSIAQEMFAAAKAVRLQNEAEVEKIIAQYESETRH